MNSNLKGSFIIEELSKLPNIRKIKKYWCRTGVAENTRN
jgi:hypothetical protein